MRFSAFGGLEGDSVELVSSVEAAAAALTSISSLSIGS